MSMYVTGRAATDPTGTMQAAVLAKAGEQYYQGTRVGDFSGITVDPTTGTTYWAANEYSIATSDLSLPNWGTWIAKFNIAGSQPRSSRRHAGNRASPAGQSLGHTATAKCCWCRPGGPSPRGWRSRMEPGPPPPRDPPCGFRRRIAGAPALSREPGIRRPGARAPRTGPAPLSARQLPPAAEAMEVDRRR